ncbi:MAG: hypothetical protein HY457_00890 [Parcubacteria group bacterium]|nr:hypothetical protein [Parcubacteria group bacterium]
METNIKELCYKFQIRSIRKGPLSDAELLVLILGKRNARGVKALLATTNLQDLECPPRECGRVSNSTRVRIQALFEFCRRVNSRR